MAMQNPPLERPPLAGSPPSGEQAVESEVPEKNSVEKLVGKAVDAEEAHEALQFSQAALSVAQALSVVSDTKTDGR